MKNAEAAERERRGRGGRRAPRSLRLRSACSALTTMRALMTDVNLRYLGIVLGLVALIVLVLRNPQQDAVRWTRQTFELLVSGRSSAQARIAWERLSAVGVDVGATYAKLPNARDQAGDRPAFLRALASGFRRSGARAESFVNWRIEESAESAEMKAQ